jgi:transcriptional regulator with XRE-family HTH domain
MVPMTPRRLLEIRKALGLSQEKMGHLIGASFASVNRWEGSHSSPVGATLDIYRAIDAALRAGHRGEKIYAAFSDDRGRFLHQLFSMAYGPKRGAA